MGKGGNNYVFNLVFIIKINSTMIFNNKKKTVEFNQKFKLNHIDTFNLLIWWFKSQYSLVRFQV